MNGLKKRIKILNDETTRNSLQIYEQSIEICSQIGEKVAMPVFGRNKTMNLLLVVLIVDLTAYTIVSSNIYAAA